MVKVSICVPAYKNPVGVERLLGSIKVQSFTDYEVVVTDDSPDGSVEEVVRRAEVPGIVYVRNAVRKGEQGTGMRRCGMLLVSISRSCITMTGSRIGIVWRGLWRCWRSIRRQILRFAGVGR